MAIDNQHPDYQKYLPKWEKIDSFCSGYNVRKYIPDLYDREDSDSIKRNRKYRDGAAFYFVSSFTARGMNGLLFSKEPKIDLPASLEYLQKNSDGAGVSIYQQAQDVAEDVIKKGRCGMFVTYPETEGAVSRDDMAQLRVFATIHKIEAEQVIDWDLVTEGAQTKLGYVVYQEQITERVGYEVETFDQLVELRLQDGVFVVRKWRKAQDANGTDKEWQIYSEAIPTDGAGGTWNEIPFTFCGSENNSVSVDDPPLWPFVDLEDRLLRNSASNEHSLHWGGFPQWWVSGLTSNHIEEMRENKIEMGGPALINVPENQQLAVATAPVESQISAAVELKIEKMIGMGARLLKRSGPAMTATQAEGEQSLQHSQLTLISSNLSEAYTQCIRWVARYMNVPETDGISFETTMDFVSPTATAQDIQAMVAGFVQGAVPMSTYFKWLQRHGLEDGEKTVEEFAEEVSVVSGAEV
jgi:hypothetical protein